jgi:hypothetical protein
MALSLFIFHVRYDDERNATLKPEKIFTYRQILKTAFIIALKLTFYLLINIPSFYIVVAILISLIILK